MINDEAFIKYVEFSNELIDKDKEILKNKGLDLDLLKFKISDHKYENIKNFFRFYILIKEGIIEDFDSSHHVIKMIEEIFSNSNYKVKYHKDRYFIIDDKYTFETDTAYSFKTIFYQFLRDYYYEEYMEYKKYNGNVDNDYDRYIYLLNKLDKCEFHFKKEHEEIINLFNVLAGLYHTINNVVLVPYGYNMRRSELFNDIYVLSISNLIEIGFDEDMIKTLGRIDNLDYDYEFYNKVKNKTRVKETLKLSLNDYKKYLNDAINYINGNERG